MNSKQLAKKWCFRRKIDFEKELRSSNSQWFKSKGFKTHSKMPYCLHSWEEWRNNIILKEVADYIAGEKAKCETSNVPFPLHKYLHHGLSSQALAFNLIGPLITRSDLDPLIKVIALRTSIDLQVKHASFEYEDRNIFNEDSGQPTSIDIALFDSDQKPRIFIESKLVEPGFGGCSVFGDGDCSGENPLNDVKRCYLHHIGRKYWDSMSKNGFDKVLLGERECVFAAHYQFFREVLFSIEKGGIFFLLSDERSPVFSKISEGRDAGLWPFLLSFVPKQHLDKLHFIKVQDILKEIEKSEKHKDWLPDFKMKYNLV